MKRIVSLAVAVLLIVTLAFSAYASELQYSYNGHIAPALPDSQYTYFLMLDTGALYALSAPNIKAGSSGSYDASAEFYYEYFYESGGSFVSAGTTKVSANHKGVFRGIIWSNFGIAGGTWEVTQPVPIVDECDGSKCPVQDTDLNNICDNCGNVLTYELRSTLLSYAKAVAESYGSGYPYYAIMEHPSSDAMYNLYISKEPMRADVPNYDVAIGDSMQWARVYTKDDGSFDRDAWVSVESFTGNLVYANHTIENFREPPLAVMIQGVTGEAMETTLPNLYQTIRTILLCGVGCLALLTLFHLLRSRLFPYLKG